MFEFEYTTHAQTVATSRAIKNDWVASTLTAPELKIPDREDPELMHALSKIPENENRVYVWCKCIYRSCSYCYSLFRRNHERQTMKVQFDQKADAIYFRLDESPIVESEEVRPGVILDFNDKDQVVGIELLSIKGRVPVEMLRQLSFEVA